MKARSRCLSLLVAALACLLVAPSPASVASPRTAAQQLAEDYSPITKVREQQKPPCGDEGTEQYEPTSVDTVLGNPTVILEHDAPGRPKETITRAPTTADVAGLGKDYYLNLNGDPLGDTCQFARDFLGLKRAGKAPAITYAHIAREPGHSGLALQYWFFWYFNKFNDLHESDWEGMQLTFDADTPAAALKQEPNEVLLFQHAGGERAQWNDAKMQKQGKHPVVYPAAGSHATFYDSSIYVENGEHGSGLGCDNSSTPVRELRPKPVMLPDQVTDRGSFAWLSFDGHWGQKEASFNNGPTGPQTKHQWGKPFSWMADQRDSSARLPGGSVAGPAVTNAFCGTVETISGILNLHARSSTETIVALSVFGILLMLFVGFTRWRPIDLEPLRARRAFGQLVRTARQLYGRHWRTLVLIAVTVVPVIGGAQLLVNAIPGESAGIQDLRTLIQTFVRPVATAVVVAVVIVFVRSLVEFNKAGFVDSWRGMSRRFWRVVLGQLMVSFLILLMVVTVIGIPFAIWKLVGWAFVQQEILFEDKSIRGAMRGSSELVRGRWLHTVRAVVLFTLIGLVTGPVLTFALIFTPLSLVLINFIGSLVFALLLPYVALGLTLLYFDLEARAETEPKPRRSWKVWRPKQFGRVVGPVPQET